MLKKFNENATMYFRVNSQQLLKNYIEIWETGEKILKANLFMVMMINT